MKKYSMSLEGLNQCISDTNKNKREKTKRNLMIVSLVGTTIFNLFLLSNPITSTAGIANVIESAIAFKPL